MITQRPTIGSLRSSGIDNPLMAKEARDFGGFGSAIECSLLVPFFLSDSLNVPHDLLEIWRRTGQINRPFAWRPVAALVPFLQLDKKLDRFVDLHSQTGERD